MNEDVARKLGPLVKNKNYQSMVDYANYRIQELYKQLSNENEVEAIRRYQGAIKELRMLTELETRVEDVIKRRKEDV